MKKLDNSLDSFNLKAVRNLNFGLEMYNCMIFSDFCFLEMAIMRKMA